MKFGTNTCSSESFLTQEFESKLVFLFVGSSVLLTFDSDFSIVFDGREVFCDVKKILSFGREGDVLICFLD